MRTSESILDTIVKEKRREVALLPQWSLSVAALQAALEARGGRRDFAAALSKPKTGRADRRGQEGVTLCRCDSP